MGGTLGRLEEDTDVMDRINGFGLTKEKRVTTISLCQVYKIDPLASI